MASSGELRERRAQYSAALQKVQKARDYVDNSRSERDSLVDIVEDGIIIDDVYFDKEALDGAKDSMDSIIDQLDELIRSIQDTIDGLTEEIRAAEEAERAEEEG